MDRRDREIRSLQWGIIAPALKVILRGRYKSSMLALVIMAGIPMSFIGGVVALWLSGQPLSIAAMVGFVTLAGVSARNGILKVSHWINLALFEGEQFGDKLILRGSLERLNPVLMTALVAAFALLPLLLASDKPGKEILHPVAVTVFGGLISSTLLDAFLTPAMFRLFGEKPLKALLSKSEGEVF